MARFVAFVFIFICALSASFAQKGVNIRVKLDNYNYKSLTLGFHYGEKQYIKDTTAIGPDGYFTFKSDTLYPSGMYLLVLKPDNNFFQVLLPADDQQFTIVTDAKDMTGKVKISGSEDNETFYEYLGYLGKLRPEADTLRAQLSRLKNQPADSARIVGILDGFDKEVKKRQANIINKYPKSLGARIIKASNDPEAPEFEGTEKEKGRKKYDWYRQHFFDNVDIADPAMLRSPVLHSKIDYYMTKFIPQHPDTINSALDDVLAKMKSNKENYRYYLIHFLNYYAKANVVGMDACYVHIAQKYYCKGEATWTKKEDLEKICDNARRLSPILIGKIAPDITVKNQQNQPMRLWDVDADYTVLFFWAPDCGHCEKAAPHMVEFAKKFKDRGVKVFAVCTAVGEKGPDCWKGVQEKGFSDFLFLNAWDPYIQSRYKTLYDVQTTPQIFILDRKHEILMKRIGAEQLGEVMEQVMKIQEEKKKEGK